MLGVLGGDGVVDVDDELSDVELDPALAPASVFVAGLAPEAAALGSVLEGCLFEPEL